MKRKRGGGTASGADTPSVNAIERYRALIDRLHAERERRWHSAEQPLMATYTEATP